MMRSLFSGVSGLKTHQTRMDVIGNNIANVNTTAYKSSSMVFSDMISQTTQKASGPNAATGTGGINAKQIGLGVKAGAINTYISGQGAAQSTNNPFDIMINGSSFFVVSNGSENFFTRDGSFYVDGAGNLAMTSTGYNVMGWLPDTEDPTTIKQDTVTALRVMTEANMTYPAQATSQATFAGIIDTNDTNVTSKEGRVVNLEVYDNKGFKYTVRCTLHDADPTADDGMFYLKINDILDSNGKSVVAAGDKISDYVTFGAAAQGPEADITAHLQYSTKDGSFINVGKAKGDTATQSAITFEFKQDKLPSFENITADFSATSNQNNNGSSTFVGSKGGSKSIGSGRKVGEMSGIAIWKDGKIYASYDNGQKRLLGQIAVAQFSNASGLEKVGESCYRTTLNSGEFDGIGVEISADGSSMTTGELEMSNVDLSSEFTSMITTQRGFQANSRVITTSDTLLEELVNLKR